MILFDNQVILFHKFPNGETYFNKSVVQYRKENITNAVTLKYEGDEDLFHLLLVREAIDYPCTLRITYFPYSRMDRQSTTYPFSLKTVAKFINSMKWKNVLIFEPHSDVTPALINRSEVFDVTASPQMRSKLNLAFLNEPYQVCYPDVGAFKRYSEKFNNPDPLIGFKVRDFETGRILTLDVHGERNLDNVAIVDDLCSKGGTFVLTARKLKEMGFKKIILMVAHCENTIFDGEVFTSRLIDKVITTDSILDRHKTIMPLLEVVSLNEVARRV